MKRCPTCQRTYPDDAPAFCVNDGTKLTDEEPSSSYDPQKTIMASAPPIPPPQIPPQYSSPAPPPAIKPPTLQQPPQYSSPAPPPQQQQAAWPPPPQGQAPPAQNWGGYQPQPGQYQNYPQQPYAAPAAASAGGGKGLTLGTLIIGLVSALALGLIFAMVNDLITRDTNVAEISYYGSAGLGVVALILGILSMISRKQRSKWMAIVGMILGLPAILFFIYGQFFHG